MSEGEQQERERSGEKERKLQPRIWIGSLADYNAGRLHGAWVDADQEPDGIWEGINDVLQNSPTPGAEEWAVFDFDDFGPVRLSEYESVERISRLGVGIAEHGEAFAAFASFLGPDEDALLSTFEETYLGHWESAEAYAQDYLDDVGIEHLLDEHVPDSLRPYVEVNVEMLARDMEFEGALLKVPDADGSGVFLFRPPGWD